LHIGNGTGDPNVVVVVEFVEVGVEKGHVYVVPWFDVVT
jgi:hypothetical protein